MQSRNPNAIADTVAFVRCVFSCQVSLGMRRWRNAWNHSKKVLVMSASIPVYQKYWSDRCLCRWMVKLGHQSNGSCGWWMQLCDFGMAVTWLTLFSWDSWFQLSCQYTHDFSQLGISLFWEIAWIYVKFRHSNYICGHHPLFLQYPFSPLPLKSLS